MSEQANGLRIGSRRGRKKTFAERETEEFRERSDRGGTGSPGACSQADKQTSDLASVRTNERASERTIGTNEQSTDRPNERTNEQTKILIVNSLKDMGSVHNSEGERWNILHIKVS